VILFIISEEISLLYPNSLLAKEEEGRNLVIKVPCNGEDIVIIFLIRGSLYKVAYLSTVNPPFDKPISVILQLCKCSRE
jgi:hypothetical protein